MTVNENIFSQIKCYENRQQSVSKIKKKSNHFKEKTKGVFSGISISNPLLLQHNNLHQ
jgi:hypothetical protein